jgi:hypothetical protein
VAVSIDSVRASTGARELLQFARRPAQGRLLCTSTSDAIVPRFAHQPRPQALDDRSQRYDRRDANRTQMKNSSRQMREARGRSS